MADEIANSTPTPAASPAAPAVVEVAPNAAPSTETPVTSPAPQADPVVVTAPTETPVEVAPEAKKVETLLGAEKKAEEVAPPAEVKTEEVKIEEKVEPTQVPESPTYELKLPEGVQVDEAKFGDFTKMLGEFETTAKVPHEEMQKLGQQMFDRHLEEMQRYNESLTQAWNKQKNDWKDSFLKSPEFANRTDTAVNAAIDAIGIYGGDVAQQKEFRELMESSGVGNHPAMIRMLSNVMLAKVEPTQLAAPQIASSAKVSKVQKMYGVKK